MRRVLLVPTAAFREALIADGPCGSRAPRAIWRSFPKVWRNAGLYRGADDPDWPEDKAPTLALALAWDGQILDDGLARLERVRGCRLTDDWPWSLEGLVAFAEWGIARDGIGRLVVADDDGREAET